MSVVLYNGPMMPLSRRVLLFLLVVLLGCGGGGGGGGGTKTAAFKVRIEWGARSRAVGLSSALSARVTLTRAAVDGSDLVWTVNRPVTAAGVPISQVYDAPVSATLGSHNLGVVFYAQANATGDAVGTAGAVAEIAEGGNNELTLSTYAGVDAVRVLPNQSVKVGETKELLIEAKNASGTVVALSTGSAFFAVTSGTASLETVNDGSAVRGKAPSTSAEVTVRVDQVTSAAAVVKVTSDTTVTVSPESGTLGSEFTLDLSAVVGGAPETGVQFAVEGGSVNGTLESVATNSATFVAPKVTGATSRVCKVIVTSNYDPSVSKTISVTVEPRTAVAITPTSPTAPRNGTTTLSATVSNLSPRVPAEQRGVTWRVLDDGSGQPVGSITAAGIYTAPNRDGTFTVEATSLYDTTKKATVGVAVQGPTFMELPLPVGAKQVGFRGLADNGGVLALALKFVSSTDWEQYLWTETGGYERVFIDAIADISADGSTVVGQATDALSNQRAALWTKVSGPLFIGGTNLGSAHTISADGQVVLVRISNTESVLWKNGTITNLSFDAWDLSGDGTVLTGFLPGTGVIRWTQSGGAQSLGTLAGYPNQPNGWLYISQSGDVITGTASSSFERAWRWTAVTGMIDLGILPGKQFSRIVNMSPDGSMVFTINGTSDPSLARYGIWTESRGLIDVQDFLTENGLSSKISGWTEVGILKCSTDKKVFVGTGKKPNGQYTNWIMKL